MIEPQAYRPRMDRGGLLIHRGKREEQLRADGGGEASKRPDLGRSVRPGSLDRHDYAEPQVGKFPGFMQLAIALGGTALGWAAILWACGKLLHRA